MSRSTLQRRLSAALTAALASAALVATAVPSAAAAPSPRATDDSCPAGKTPAAGFSDTDGTTHEASIDCIVAWNVAKGTGGDRYEPTNPVRRDAMASFIANTLRASGVTVPTNAPDAFADDQGNVHEDNINALAQLGVVKGTGANTYGPTLVVNRAQMASFLNAAYAEITGAALTTSEDFFTDDDTNVHEDNINAVASVGIAAGRSDGSYDPAGAVDRGGMGSFIARELDLLVEDGEASPPFLQARLEAKPAEARTFTDEAYTVTFTLFDANVDPVANAPVDIHVIEKGKSACTLTGEANPNKTGTACTIDALDPLTDSNGQVSFTYEWAGPLDGERTHEVIAFTGELGATYANTSGLKGMATSKWIEPVATVQILEMLPANPSYGTQTAVTAQAVDDEGEAVPIEGEGVVFSVVRGQSACGRTPVGGSTVAGPTLDKTDANGRATFSYTGPEDPSATAENSTTDCIVATYDANADGTRQTTEPGDGETRTYSDSGAEPGQFTVSPATDTTIVNGQHAVQAAVRDTDGNLLAGQDVLFRVYRDNASPNSQTTPTQSGYRTTDANGVATFAYFGPSVGADDIIIACLDDERDGCGGFATVGGVLVPQEPDTTTSVREYWMEVAPASTDAETYDGDILAFDTSADRIDFEPGAENYRVTYDGGDTFTVDGTSATLAQFEAALAEGATLSVNYKPGAVSTFALTT